MSTTRRRNANFHSTRLFRKQKSRVLLFFWHRMHVPLWRLCVRLDPRFPARRTDTSSFFLSLRSRGLLAERRMYFLEQASQPDAHLPLTRVSSACHTRQANCEPKSLLPRTSFPARRTPTSRVERAGASDSVHPTPCACTHSGPGALRLWARHHGIVVKNVVAAHTVFLRHAFKRAFTAQAKGSARVRECWLCAGHRRWVTQ